MRIRTIEEYHEAYKHSVEDPESFWADVAQEFIWKKPWKKVLEWDFNNEYNVKWFKGGKLNITENCLDRHAEHKPNQPAIIWEPNDPEDEPIVLTYKVLFNRVCSFANVLKKNEMA